MQHARLQHWTHGDLEKWSKDRKMNSDDASLIKKIPSKTGCFTLSHQPPHRSCLSMSSCFNDNASLSRIRTCCQTGVGLQGSWWRLQTSSLPVAFQSWRPMIHWANNKHRQEPWQMQHLVYANKWVVKTLRPNSHSEVLSVLKYLQMDGRTDWKKEKTQNKHRRRCHIPLECSIFTATQASSSTFLEWKHPALSSRSVRSKKTFHFLKKSKLSIDRFI